MRPSGLRSLHDFLHGAVDLFEDLGNPFERRMDVRQFPVSLPFTELLLGSFRGLANGWLGHDSSSLFAY